MRTLAIATLVLAGVLNPPFVAHAQTQPADHAASPAAITQALQQRTAEIDAQRERVRQLLHRAEVRNLAGGLGIDLRRAESAVATLEGPQLADATAQAERLERALAGGQSNITISTTVLIIGLLLLIVLILAV